jgi:type IV pilus assembly protein PilE
MRRKYCGVTLIELMVVVVIVAILMIIATINYSGQVRNGRRTDGINTLYSISLAEERYRTINTIYGTLAQVWAGVTTSTGGYYSLAISNVTATTYTLTATATGDQANDKEGATSCATLTMTMSAGSFSNTPAVCWPS